MLIIKKDREIRFIPALLLWCLALATCTPSPSKTEQDISPVEQWGVFELELNGSTWEEIA